MKLHPTIMPLLETLQDLAADGALEDAYGFDLDADPAALPLDACMSDWISAGCPTPTDPQPLVLHPAALNVLDCVKEGRTADSYARTANLANRAGRAWEQAGFPLFVTGAEPGTDAEALAVIIDAGLGVLPDLAPAVARALYAENMWKRERTPTKDLQRMDGMAWWDLHDPGRLDANWGRTCICGQAVPQGWTYVHANSCTAV